MDGKAPMGVILSRLQDWYSAQCNGDWEHQHGVRIETLDNPGWRVSVDLAGTELEEKVFVPLVDLEPAERWISCRVVDGKFEGAGGPPMLQQILSCFLEWAEGRTGGFDQQAI